MAYVSFHNSPKIGDWVVTKRVHSSCGGMFEIGTKVQIYAIDQMRGYSIQDEFGNRVGEIGWVI